MEQKIALIDMDGTLVDFFGVLEEDLRAMCAPTEEFVMPLFDDKVAWLENRVKTIVNQTGWWTRVRKNKLGWDIFEVVQELGFRIEVLTKGPDDSPNAWTEKWQWCKDNIKCKHGVTVTEDKSLVFGDVLIDDYHVYVAKWLDRHEDGVAIMPDNCYHKPLVGYPNVVFYDGTNLNEVREKLIEVVENVDPVRTIDFLDAEINKVRRRMPS